MTSMFRNSRKWYKEVATRDKPSSKNLKES